MKLAELKASQITFVLMFTCPPAKQSREQPAVNENSLSATAAVGQSSRYSQMGSGLTPLALNSPFLVPIVTVKQVSIGDQTPTKYHLDLSFCVSVGVCPFRRSQKLVGRRAEGRRQAVS